MGSNYFLILFLRSQPPRWLVFGIVPLLFLPAALLLAPILIPPTLWEYALRIVAWQFGLAFFALALARISRCNLPVTVALTNIALILGDILTGQNLLKDSLLSGYALSGIRYYGIGNEYLGVVLAFALTDPEKGTKGITAFLLTPDMPGFRFGPPEDKMGLKASSTSMIFLEDCECPAENCFAR